MKYKILGLILFAVGLYALSVVIGVVVSNIESITRFRVFECGFFTGLFVMAFSAIQGIKLLFKDKEKK